MSAPTLAHALPGDLVHIETNPVTEPFWTAACEGRLTAAKCGACGTFRMPPTPFCPNCRSTEIEWPTLSGRATVFSFSIVRGFPGLPDALLVAAVLDLDGAPGARLVSNITDVIPEDVEIGMPVRVHFARINDGWQLPLFRPVNQ